MKPARKLTRRSFFATVAGGAVGSAGALTLVSDDAAAQRQCSGSTDSDGGASRDPVGCGRGGRPPSLNQGPPAQTGVTDTDLGPGSDPVGRGRGGSRARPPSAGVTDGDTGQYADRAGSGRETPRFRAEACSLARFNLAHVEREISETWNDEQMMQADQALARLRALGQEQQQAYYGVSQFLEAQGIVAAFGGSCGPNHMENVTNCSSAFGGMIQGQLNLRQRLASNQAARQNYLEQIARYCG